VIRLHVGRSDDHRWAALSDDALISCVSKELATILGQSVDPSESLVQRWADGLPQYAVGHAELVRNAKEAAVSLACTSAATPTAALEYRPLSGWGATSPRTYCSHRASTAATRST